MLAWVHLFMISKSSPKWALFLKLYDSWVSICTHACHDIPGLTVLAECKPAEADHTGSLVQLPAQKDFPFTSKVFFCFLLNSCSDMKPTTSQSSLFDCFPVPILNVLTHIDLKSTCNCSFQSWALLCPPRKTTFFFCKFRQLHGFSLSLDEIIMPVAEGPFYILGGSYAKYGFIFQSILCNIVTT